LGLYVSAAERRASLLSSLSRVESERQCLISKILKCTVDGTSTLEVLSSISNTPQHYQ
jgi:hypothetical protein